MFSVSLQYHLRAAREKGEQRSQGPRKKPTILMPPSDPTTPPPSHSSTQTAKSSRRKGKGKGEGQYSATAEGCLPVTAELRAQPRRIGWRKRKQEGR